MALNSGSAGAISARLSQHPAQLTTPRIQVLEKERQRTAAQRWAESEHPVPVHGSLAYEEVIAFADMSLYSHPNHLDGAYWKANGWAAVIQGVGNAAVDCRAALSYGEGGLRFARFWEVRRRCASLTVRTSQSPWRRTSPIAHFRNSATGHGYIATLILRTAPLLPSREGGVARYWHFDW